MIVFMDANVEVTDGWFEPLLSRIASDRSVIAVPHIDHINNHNLSYEEFNRTVIYGFGWDLFYNECVILNFFSKDLELVELLNALELHSQISTA